MTKLIARIATGIAIVGLAAPVFASTGSANAPAAVQTSSVRHRHHAHKKVASADQKKTSKGTEKKVEKKGGVKGTANVEKPGAAPSATPAPASK